MLDEDSLMRKTVYMIDVSKKYNKNWYEFKGISVSDIYYFFNKKYKNISIYYDIPDDDEGECTYKFSILKKKRIKSKFNLFSRHNDFGTDVMIITDDETNLFNYSHQEVFDLVKKNPEIMNGIPFFMSVHDHDWHAVCYFATDDILKKIMTYIKSRAILVITDDYSYFS